MYRDEENNNLDSNRDNQDFVMYNPDGETLNENSENIGYGENFNNQTNSDTQYNFEQRNYNNQNGFNNAFNEAYRGYNNPNKKKNRNNRKVAKVVGVVAAGIALAMTCGLAGSMLTYSIIKNNGNVIEAKSYAPPQFTSSTEGAMSAAEAFEKVKPAVVTISVKSIQPSYYGMFNQEVSGIGSGFIINEDGYILTNYHVIEGAKEVTVLLSDGNEVKAKVVNYDQAKDMAMIKLEDGTKVPGIAELGDSDALYPGEDVIAIGTPLSKDFAQTMTKGVISAVNRSVQASTGVAMNVIQTDTAINPGNSGGPLVNTKGQVIGINSMKLAENNVEGIGFAIPINDAKERIESLSKPIITLGVTVREIDEELAKKYDYEEGLYIRDIQEFSPAEKSGMRIGDIIVKFGGKRIKTFDDLNEEKNKKNVGDNVEVVVNRDGKEVTLTLELTEK